MTTSCSYKILSDYDEITDKSVNALQEKTATFFVKIKDQIGTADADYNKHKAFYDEVKVGLKNLKVRADAFDKNSITQGMIAKLNLMVTDLESLHKLGISSKDEIEPLENAFDSAYTGIIKFQIALKRGKK